MSVVDGTITDVCDGVPDNMDIYTLPPFSFDTGTGNRVIIDIGEGKYACYCHIITGSIRVKKGNTVKEGQVISLQGNTGQSDAPHLHFEVVTGKPSIIGGEGYPFVFHSHDLIADVNQTHAEEISSLPEYSGKKIWQKYGDIITFFPEPIPQENYDVVRFP